MAVTLQQIAEAAGVSRGTVDRALNNRGRIRPEVEERIKRIAREMGYQPAVPVVPLHGKEENPYRCDPSVYGDSFYAAGFKGSPGSKRRSGELWRNSKDL